MDDGESERFTREIMALLRSAGWVINQDLVKQEARVPIPTGVLVESPGPEGEALVELGLCLWDLGFQVEGRDETSAELPNVHVGVKPRPGAPRYP